MPIREILTGDCGILEAHGCDLVFHPGVEEMYPEGAATFVELRSDMTKQLCGKVVRSISVASAR